MGEAQFAFRMDQDRRDELSEMSRETGINAASIVRNAIYEKLEEWRKGKEAKESA